VCLFSDVVKLVDNILILLRREDTRRSVTWVVYREVLKFLRQEASDSSPFSAKNNMSAYLGLIDDHYIHHPYLTMTQSNLSHRLAA